MPKAANSPVPFWLQYAGWRARLFSVLCGALAVPAFAPLHIWPLGLLSFALLFMRLQHASSSGATPKAGRSIAFWHGIGFFGAGVFWVGSAFIVRGASFIAIMPFMVLALAIALSLFWAVAGGVFIRLRLSGLRAALGFTAIFTLAELARGHLFGGFPWNLPGYIFEAGSHPSQIAAYINIYGLSWIVLFISACLGLFLVANHRLKSGVLGLIILGILFGFGYIRLSQSKVILEDNVNLRLVGVSFSQADKFDPEKSFHIVNQFLMTSLAPGIEDVTHLIWPEGAVNGLAMENEPLLAAMGRELVGIDDTPPVWIMNSLRLETLPHPRKEGMIENYYNSSVAITYDALGYPMIAAYNDKRRLVPFGEFFPGGKWLETFDFPIVSTALASISPAPKKTLVDFPGLPKTSAQICFEADFPGLTPQDRSAPAQLIINQTNDAWYGQTWGPHQHANIARYRALEEGLPMIRSASNGLSAVIDPYGRILARVDTGNMSYVDTALPKAIQKKRVTKRFIWGLVLINFLITCILSLSRRELGLR